MSRAQKLLESFKSKKLSTNQDPMDQHITTFIHPLADRLSKNPHDKGAHDAFWDITAPYHVGKHPTEVLQHIDDTLKYRHGHKREERKKILKPVIASYSKYLKEYSDAVLHTHPTRYEND